MRSEPSRWAQQRPFLLDLCRAWKADLETRGLARSVVVELYPESVRAPTTPWDWWLSFDLDGTEFDALVVPDHSVAVFEDSTGVFDDHVKLGDVPAYLERRMKESRSAPA
ncbi:hypothetical protein ATK30_1326 [Amycolatopsis echigonensis]|uniref:Uncharacterized protein n=1 Tax=Amycolatopsis echigonensis TaxID=2576905 RepID=A0A2N3W9M7_9PSEU|nr:hypothetical protein [Amycolatopsis niigatensis]PKV90578.1 hypothetical protein ATK30_1326 [Amycolatopsis niigatensis]